ncbi:MAG: ABC transporter substrate-binding protein [Acidobacteria bacterium]|nr:ABC transporter substrate-binding protein [Acidobacteriota bacterium]
MPKKHLFLILLTAFALIAAACGDDDGGGDDGDDSETTTTVEATDDAFGDDDLEGSDDGSDDGTADELCEGVTLEATDTGVTEDTLTVFVMADVGFELAPGLFQGSIDGAEAWAEKVNDEGGLGCRQVELIVYDSALNAVETENGFLNACDTSVAMVGSTALSVADASAIENCGLADIPERTVATGHQCSPNVFMVAPGNGSCPYSGEGPRDFLVAQGAYEWILENDHDGGPVEGVFVIPSDLPSTIEASMPSVEALNMIGVNTFPDGEFGMSGLAEQAVYGSIIQYMVNNDVKWAHNGSNDQSMLKWRNEAAAQNFDNTGVSWICTIACYTPELVDQGGENVEGTYSWMPFLPFNETDTNEELAKFIEYLGSDFPASWAATAWASGLVFEQVIGDIMETEGPNGITSEAILAGLDNVAEFDANGWFGPVNIAERIGSPCFVLLQVENGEFVRRHPEEPGTLDCDAEVDEIVGLDAAERYQG